MTYRLDTPLREFGGTSSQPAPRSNTELNPPVADNADLGAHWLVHNFEEFDCGAHPLCRLYRAPSLSDGAMSPELKLMPTKRPMREIIVLQEKTFVSERVRQIIEDQDDFGHQFREIRIWDDRNNSYMDTGQPYYRMHMRRFVSLHPVASESRVNEFREDYVAKLDFDPGSEERAYIPTIWQNPSLREVLESLPLWQHTTADRPGYRHHYTLGLSPLYMNEPMLRRLQQAGVDGIDEYSTWEGKRGEYVSHV